MSIVRITIKINSLNAIAEKEYDEKSGKTPRAFLTSVFTEARDTMALMLLDNHIDPRGEN